VIVRLDHLFATKTNITTLGRNFGANIATALKNSNSPLFNLLKNKLNISDLHLYDVLTEVPLATSGGFMKADVVLVKKNAITQKITDVVIIENKLSKNTSYTIRQKEGFRAIGNDAANLTVKYGIKKELIDANFYLNTGDLLPISQPKCVKISDHGSSSISNLSIGDISAIDYTIF
jgi:hypothetical protein